MRVTNNNGENLSYASNNEKKNLKCPLAFIKTQLQLSYQLMHHFSLVENQTYH